MWGAANAVVALQLFHGGALLGATLVPNMTLGRGNNSFLATGNFTVGIVSKAHLLMLLRTMCLAK